MNERKPIPRHDEDNYTEEAAAERREFLVQETGADFQHTGYYNAPQMTLMHSRGKGPHSANGIAALFIATGQDEANMVESHTGINFFGSYRRW